MKLETFCAGTEGEEKAIHTSADDLARLAIKTPRYSNYAADTLDTSVTYKGTVDRATVVDALEITNVIKSETFYTGNEGEEKAILTQNYDFAGLVIKTSTVFNYAADTLDTSVTYKGTVDRATVVDALEITNVIQS